MNYKRYKLPFGPQNALKTYGFPVSPPQAPKKIDYFGLLRRKFLVFAPPYFGTLGGNFFLPPHISEPWGGELKNHFPPIIMAGGKKEPLVNRLMCVSGIRDHCLEEI